MKCLSVKNPLSYLICAGIKDVENRTWTTKYRGRIYIHSSGKNLKSIYRNDLPKEIFKEFKEKIEFKDGIANLKSETKFKDLFRKLLNLQNIALETGLNSQAIIGHVDIIDIIKNSKSPFAIKNQYHWILENPILFEKPILNIKGKLKFFNLEVEHV